MAKISAAESTKRREYAISQWKKDPKLSIPKMNEAIKKEFNGMVNTQNLYKWRTEFWKANGIKPAELTQVQQNKVITKKGSKPALPGGKKTAQAQLSAAREPGEPASPFETVVIPIKNEGEAQLLQRAFDQLKMQGFVNCRIVDFTSHYAIVSRA